LRRILRLVLFHSLKHVVNLQNDWPVVLGGHVSRLPAPAGKPA
jgi:hypothetical protein